MLKNPFVLLVLNRRVIRRFTLSLIRRHLCLAFIFMHAVMLGRVTLLPVTIRTSAGCFFSSPLDPLHSGLSCCKRRWNFAIRRIANYAWRCTLCIINLALMFCFRFAPKCPCSYQILNYLKLRSFYQILR